MDIEQEAREMGWQPQEEFRGDPNKWVSAEDFVERGRTLMPILRKNNDRLHQELGQVKGELQTVKQSLAEATEAMNAYAEYASTAAKQAYEKAVQDLQTQKEQAAEDGDMRGMLAADKALDKLRETAPKELKKVTPPETPPQERKQQVDPTAAREFQEWKAEHPWVDTDAEKTTYASSISTYLRVQNPTLTGRAFLDKLAEEVEARFGGKEKPVNRTDGGGRQFNSGKSKSYDAMPAEAKAACDRFGAKLVGPNKQYKDLNAWRKKYAEDYFMGE